MEPVLHRAHGDGSVHVVRRADAGNVEFLLLLVQHFAPVFIDLGVRIFLLQPVQAAGIDLSPNTITYAGNNRTHLDFWFLPMPDGSSFDWRTAPQIHTCWLRPCSPQREQTALKIHATLVSGLISTCTPRATKSTNAKKLAAQFARCVARAQRSPPCQGSVRREGHSQILRSP